MKHPLLTVDRTQLESDFIEQELRLQKGFRVLDVGCGFGRHSIELASRGYGVTGIDPSAAMIEAARANAAQAGCHVDFRQGRGECFSSDEPFDAAICLFTTLGQIGQEGDNLGLVPRVYSALKPGVRFLVEVPQRDTAVRSLRPYEEIGEGPRRAIVSRSYDEVEQVISEEFRVISGDDEQAYLLRYRLFDQGQLSSLLEGAGFEVAAAYSSFDGVSLSNGDATMLMVARKVA